MDRQRRWLGLALAGALAGASTAAGARAPSAEELTNFQLGPEHARWLVGPIARLASEAERAEYLRLADDAAAGRFIAAFWERRGGLRSFPPTPGHLFQERAAEADVLYREGHHVGRSTDRGTIYVLYGPPAATRFEPSPTPGGGAVEIWRYPKEASPGLDGERPKTLYSFRREEDGLTRFYRAPIQRRLGGSGEPAG